MSTVYYSQRLVIRDQSEPAPVKAFVKPLYTKNDSKDNTGNREDDDNEERKFSRTAIKRKP